MAHALRNEFPEYKRKKFRVFKSNVESIVEFEQRKLSNKNAGNDSPVLTVSSDSEEADVNDFDRNVSIVKGPSLNKTLSKMYSNNQDFTGSNNGERINRSKVRKIETVQDSLSSLTSGKKSSMISPVVNGSPKRKPTSTFKTSSVSSRRGSEEAEMIDLSNEETSNQNQTISLMGSKKIINGALQPSSVPNTNSSDSNVNARKQSTSASNHTTGTVQTPVGKQRMLRGVAKNKIGAVESKVTFADLGGINSTLIKVLDLDYPNSPLFLQVCYF